MSSWAVPLSDVVVTEEEISTVADVYRSGWLSLGPRTAELEAALAAYTGAKHVLAVANGTAALHLMCLAAGLKPGDEVIVPSLTFVATVNAVRYAGAHPVFADIVGLEEPWLDPAAVEGVITSRTRAVMAMSYGGHSGEIEALSSICQEHGLILLEDAAHGLGARLHGRHLGTFGKAGAFSFFSNKNLAIGEGGAVACDDDELAGRIRLLRSHGMTSLSWDRHKGHASGYDVVALGFNYRIDEPRAALAARRLRDLDEGNRRRREHDAWYRERFTKLGLICPLPARSGLVAAHHLFCIVLPEQIDRAAFREELSGQRVQTSMHYPPVHEFSIYRDAARDSRLARTDAYARQSVTLPMFPHMTEDQLERVAAAVESSLDRAAPV